MNWENLKSVDVDAIPGERWFPKETSFTEDMQEYFMPFYRFLVELPEDPNVPMAQSLTMYGAYYVPAIPEEYLEDVGEAELYFNGGRVSSQP